MKDLVQILNRCDWSKVTINNLSTSYSCYYNQITFLKNSNVRKSKPSDGHSESVFKYLNAKIGTYLNFEIRGIFEVIFNYPYVLSSFLLAHFSNSPFSYTWKSDLDLAQQEAQKTCGL